MTTTDLAGLADYRQFARTTWASGDFPEIARRGLWGVRQHIVHRVGVGTGERVLDVACGIYDRHEPGEYLVVLGRKG